MKICTKCKIEKDLSEFWRDKSRGDGLQTRCRGCCKRDQQSEVTRAFSKRYRQQHREELAKYQKKYCATIRGYLRRIYFGMVARCNDPKKHNYSRYGGRGIRVCFSSSTEFIKYVINKLQVDPRGLQIDRINNDGNYECGNIRFITRLENQQNKESYGLVK